MVQQNVIRIIVCYDDTELSKTVLKEAHKHARLWHAELEIVKAVDRDEPIRHEKLLEMEEELESHVQDLLENEDIPYSVQLHVDDISVGEKIVDLAESLDAAMIFLGIRKHSRVGKMLFGSTAQYIILHASCPVVTINPGMPGV